MNAFVKKIENNLFGNCIHLSNDKIEAMVSLDYGPRIVHFSLLNGENLFFEDKDRKLKEQTNKMKIFYGENAVWYSVGGHRHWVSPESMPETYYPDNDPVEYHIIGNKAILDAPPQSENGVQLSLEMAIAESDAKMVINHKLKNISHQEKTLANWAITVMAGGGIEVIPRPTKATGYLPNATLSIWPYTDMDDCRVNWGTDFITLRQESIHQNTGMKHAPFKIGINNEAGWASYINKGVMFLKEYRHNPDGLYPDFGVSYETYTNADIIELETLGELCNLKPGEITEHEEIWSIKKIPENFSELGRK